MDVDVDVDAALEDWGLGGGEDGMMWVVSIEAGVE